MPLAGVVAAVEVEPCECVEVEDSGVSEGPARAVGGREEASSSVAAVDVDERALSKP